MTQKKYSREELQSMLDNYQEDDEVEEIRIEENGRVFHLKGKRATSILDKLFSDYGFSEGDGTGEGGGEQSSSTGDADTETDTEDKGPKSSIWGRK
jgi:hypothetical protein